MTQRERNLAIVTGSLVGLFVVYMLASKVFLQPAAELRESLDARKVELADLRDEIERQPAYLRHVREMAEHTYAADPAKASEKARARLDQMLRMCNLPVDMNPISPKSIKYTKGDQYVGWSITTRGKLDEIYNFLYLVQHDPYIKRIEGLNISPVSRSTDYNLRLQYQTLVLENPPASPPDKPLPFASLKEARHEKLWALVRRDVFHPYVRKPQPQVAVTPRKDDADDPPPPPPPPPPPKPVFKIVGLPSTSEGKDVWVLNSLTGQAKRYEVGEQLSMGRIVAVDIRALPDPTNPQLNSPSRVIVEDKSGYWAVELGQTFNDRRRLKADELPDELRREQASQAKGEADASTLSN